MHLYKPRPRFGFLKMELDRLQNIGPQLFPRIAFGENRVAQRSRAIAAFLRVANLED